MNAPNIRPAGDPIRRYLAQLAGAAFDQDAALVNDMLADAEEHLRNAVRAGVSAQQAVEEFGEPADVVEAYLAADRMPRGSGASPLPRWAAGRDTSVSATGVAGGSRATSSSAANAGGASTAGATSASTVGVDPAFVGGGGAASTARPPAMTGVRTETLPPDGRVSGIARVPLLGVLFNRYAWGSLALFILGLVPAVAYFVIMVTGVSLAFGLFSIVIGLPLMVLMLGVARAMALWHGAMIEFFTGVRMPRRFAPIPASGSEGFLGRIKLWITDGRSWLSAGYLVGNFPVAVALFSLFVTLISLGLGMLATPIAQLFGVATIQLGNGAERSHVFFFDREVVPDASGNIHLTFAESMLAALAGLLILIGTLYLARAMGWLYAQCTKAIQVTRPQLMPGT